MAALHEDVSAKPARERQLPMLEASSPVNYMLF
jgi:ribosome biogenesis protein Tsr3